MKKVVLNRMSHCGVFYMKYGYLFHYTKCMEGNSRSFVQEFVFKMETEVRRRVWFFDENPTANRALYKTVSLKFSFCTILFHTVYVMPFLVIFSRRNAVISMELQDFLQVSWGECYTESEKHGYAYFSIRILLLESRDYTRGNMK